MRDMVMEDFLVECITWQGAVTFLTLNSLCSLPPIYTRARVAYQCPSMRDMVVEDFPVKFILCSRSISEQNRRTSRDRNSFNVVVGNMNTHSKTSLSNTLSKRIIYQIGPPIRSLVEYALQKPVCQIHPPNKKFGN